MTSFEPVRAIERALEILEFLNRHRVVTIKQIHEETQLPKPTIVRILQTFEQTGYVTNDQRHGGYQVTSRVTSLSSGFHGDPMVVEAGRPHAAALTKLFTWPTSIAILGETEVIVRYSTIPDSPNSPFHATVNMQLSLHQNALGLAYLAFCKPALKKRLICDTLGVSPNNFKNDERVGMLEQKLLGIVAQRYADRDNTKEPFSSNTMAVPVHGANGVLGSIGITYYRSAMSLTAAKRKFLTKLEQAAAKISRDIKNYDAVGPAD